MFLVSNKSSATFTRLWSHWATSGCTRWHTIILYERSKAPFPHFLGYKLVKSRSECTNQIIFSFASLCKTYRVRVGSLLASLCTHGASQHSIWPKYFKVFYNSMDKCNPPSPSNCWYLPAIIWSKPTGGAICSWFQFPPHTGGWVP